MRRTRSVFATLAVAAAAAATLALPGSATAAAPAPAAVTAGGVSVLGMCNYSGSHPEISSGASGEVVAHAQCLLRNVWGYKDVAVDGQFGPTTRKYVVKAQGVCGITQDGIIGPKTWDCLH